mmetsp:Transcript_32592/g.68415  ORF Transcript_32592/g.68415 Transcript_32592/m.68415 type:complete len:174 (+) Transcript_32592:238-759(+)
MTRPEEVKLKERYSRYLTQINKIDSQLKQCYHKYYEQCNSNMKASLEEDHGFKEAHRSKDVIKLRAILRTVTSHFRKSKEPIKTLWKANKDFMNLRQGRIDITNYYKKFVDLKSLVDEMTREEEGTYNQKGIIDIVCREKGLVRANITSKQEVEFMMSGQERMLAMHFIMNSN